MNKQITPMSKVFNEMKLLRTIFNELGYIKISLNKKEEKKVDYREWMSMNQKVSIKGKIESNYIELFSKELETKYKTVLDKFQFGVAFKYEDLNDDKIITLSITEKVYIKKYQDEKPIQILKGEFYSEAMSLVEFKEQANKIVDFLSSEKRNTEDLKEWFVNNLNVEKFNKKQNQKQVNRMLKKSLKK